MLDMNTPPTVGEVHEIVCWMHFCVTEVSGDNLISKEEGDHYVGLLKVSNEIPKRLDTLLLLCMARVIMRYSRESILGLKPDIEWRQFNRHVWVDYSMEGLELFRSPIFGVRPSKHLTIFTNPLKHRIIFARSGPLHTQGLTLLGITP